MELAGDFEEVEKQELELGEAQNLNRGVTLIQVLRLQAKRSRTLLVRWKVRRVKAQLWHSGIVGYKTYRIRNI